ncbi:LPS-assembly protein LptD [Mesorhizobium sp. CAU 1741]|uniref:LPS-assembly protein LptD n=1 Tax=Mesorhizobium sp. CAU 1741 TaxID=3140366 RepID=UPI00325AD48C
MNGEIAKKRRSARMLHLLGASALALGAAAFAVPAPVLAQDLGFEDAGLSSDAEMLLEADTIVYDNDRNTITAVGGVRIDYDGNRLVAQRVTYDRATSRLIASGNVEIVDPQGTRFSSDQIDVTDDFRDAFVRTLRVETADQTYFAAESAERADGALTTFNRGVYTACAPCEDRPGKPPIWRVKAQKIIWNGETETVRFERARFEFFGLPLAFLPAFEIADPTVEQKSGFLLPSYRSGSELGHGLLVPYYWAVSPTADVTFKPTVYSKQGFLAEAEWRQQFDNGSYSITIAGIKQRSPEEFYSDAASSLWASDNEDYRGMVGSKGAFRINPRWTFGWDVMAQSDKNFSHRYAIEGYDQLDRTDSVYLTGLNDRNYFNLSAYRFTVQEAVRDTNPVTGEPYWGRNGQQPWVLPSFDYAFTPDNSIAGGELNIDVNVQGIRRDQLDATNFTIDGRPQSMVQGIEGTSGRVTAEAEWKRSFIAPGGLMLTPILHARGDAIGVDYSGGSQNAISLVGARNGFETEMRSSFYRAMATAGLEARWPVLFSTTSSLHVLEPMGQIFARPDAAYANRLGIPNEDAQSLVFDASNLFERDKFSGYDRMEGGVRANLGIRYSGTFSNGWSSTALVGQSFHIAGLNSYASADLVHTGAYSGLETDRSDYVAAANVVSPGGLALGAGGRFDEANFDLRRADLTAGVATTPVTLAATYSFIEEQPDYGFEEDRHEIRGSASVRFDENWRAFGSGTYNMTEEVFVAKSIGFAYDDECFSYTMAATEYVDPTNPSQKSRGFSFGISLRTIGDFGSSSGG